MYDRRTCPKVGASIPKPYNPIQLAETLQDWTADFRRSMDVQDAG